VVKDSIVWEPDFEQANFTLAELAEIATRVATSGGLQVMITEEEIKAQMRKGMGQRRGSAGDAVMKLLGRATYPMGKGKAWGHALADWAIGTECPTQVADDSGRRSAISLFELMLQGQSSNYEATFEDSE
jgi:hypothetical protein